MTSLRSYLFIAPHNENSQALQRVIESTLDEFNMKPLSIKKIEGRSLPNVVYDSTQRADLIIADVSGENPDVMYELGLAQGMRKMVLPIISRAEKELPKNLILTSPSYLVYDPQETDSFRRYLKSWAANYLPVVAGG